MATRKSIYVFWAALAVAVVSPVRADEAGDDAAAGAAAAVDVALKEELDYVNALIMNGFADFANIVIENAKKRWPGADVQFFASEIRALLGVGKYAEAEKRIAALTDRSGSKYWAARLELANNYAQCNRKSECSQIYKEFFAKYPTPPKDLFEFYTQACYTYGQILVRDSNLKEAVGIYASLLNHLKKGDESDWCLIACETSDLYIKLANETKDKKTRAEYVKKAGKIADEMIWKQHIPVYFGRAIAMKAHVELMLGNAEKAQRFVSEYMPMLKEIHERIVKSDPGNKMGLVKLSPMPQCRFLLAEMLWKEAQEEYNKVKRDDERVKTLLFGERVGGRRNGAGAYNHALNVFINHPESSWSAKAGEMADQIENFANTKYNANIKKQISAEQIRKVREMQFIKANEIYLEGEYEKAAKAYFEALSAYPEGRISVSAIENIVSCYQHLMREDPNLPKEKVESYRIDLDTIQGYMAERFAGHQDKAVMVAAGDAALRMASSEKQFGDKVRAERLYKQFLKNYRRHINAPGIAASLAADAFKDEDWEKAKEYYNILQTSFSTNNTFYVPSLYQLSICYTKLGDETKAIESLLQYTKCEENALKRMQSQMVLAQMYQKAGLDMLKYAETNSTPEAVEKAEIDGSRQIIYGIKQFNDFAEKAKKAIENPATPKSDLPKYEKLREGAMYLVGDCWGRLTKPQAKMKDFRARSIDTFETYVKEYPQGEYARRAYVKLGTMYTVVGEVEKSKEALSRLSKFFPDSDEAKNAKPRLARNLIEMGLKDEGTQIYAEMLRTDGAYTAWQFINAGDALIEARSWHLANQAFEKAASLANTNQLTVVARARLGQAKSFYRQKNYTEAREALDLILEDEKMSKLSMAIDANFLLVEVASEQGRTERDQTLRNKTFGAAIGALRKVRNYWKVRNEPMWKQDSTYIMSAEIMVKRMQAEEAMNLHSNAIESCERAATTLQSFLQSHTPTESHTIEQFDPGERKNLERCYVLMVPLFAKLGGERADKVLKYGSEYLTYFPNGADKQIVLNSMNQARAEGAQEYKPEEAEGVKQEQAPEAAENAQEVAPQEQPKAEEVKENNSDGGVNEN